MDGYSADSFSSGRRTLSNLGIRDHCRAVDGEKEDDCNREEASGGDIFIKQCPESLVKINRDRSSESKQAVSLVGCDVVNVEAGSSPV